MTQRASVRSSLGVWLARAGVSLAALGCSVGCGASQDSLQATDAGLKAGTDFGRCPWPTESAPETNHASVRLRVLVAPDGSARGTELASAEPANQGFGERAEACAREMKFEPGVLPNGSPTQAWTPIFRVEFQR